MVNQFIKIIFVILLLSCLSFSQKKDSISIRNKQLEQIKKEIELLEKELSNKSKKEKESLEFLERSSKQSLLIQKLINNLIAEENQKSAEIQKTEEKIAEIENKISLLKQKYSRYIVWVYKNRNTSALKYLIGSNSIGEMLKRYKYLKFISEQNKKDLKLLSLSKMNLAKYKNQLQQEKEQKEMLMSQKIEEQKKLALLQEERKQLIASLRRDKKIIEEEIDSKRKAEIEIKNLIFSLVEKERINKARLLEEKTKNKIVKPALDYAKLENFDRLKGKLLWPVKAGKIARRFGENKNEKLNTITLNYGVDIATKSQQEIVAVAEGIVSTIEWIPGYGSVIILTHNNQYRTVYGHVGDIKVKEGDVIKAGTVIGRVSESLEGNILHFEIWNERNYQNPELWLARR